MVVVAARALALAAALVALPACLSPATCPGEALSLRWDDVPAAQRAWPVWTNATGPLDVPAPTPIGPRLGWATLQAVQWRPALAGLATANLTLALTFNAEGPAVVLTHPPEGQVARVETAVSWFLDNVSSASGAQKARVVRSLMDQVAGQRAKATDAYVTYVRATEVLGPPFALQALGARLGVAGAAGPVLGPGFEHVELGQGWRMQWQVRPATHTVWTPAATVRGALDAWGQVVVRVDWHDGRRASATDADEAVAAWAASAPWGAMESPVVQAVQASCVARP